MWPNPIPRRSPYHRTFGTPSPTLVALAHAVCQAREHERQLRPRIEQLQRQALAEQPYHADLHWVSHGLYKPGQTRITEPGRAYEMEAGQFEAYAAHCATLYGAAGYEVAPGDCPLLLAEHVRSEAELRFGLAGGELRLRGLDPEQVREFGGELWPQFVQLLLDIVLPPPPAGRDPEPDVR